MNCISVMVEAAKDGGLVVYAENDGTMSLVYAGNAKDVCDYIAKRVGELKAEKAVAVQKSLRDAYEIPYTVDEDRVTQLRRTGAIA